MVPTLTRSSDEAFIAAFEDSMEADFRSYRGAILRACQRAALFLAWFLIVATLASPLPYVVVAAIGNVAFIALLKVVWSFIATDSGWRGRKTAYARLASVSDPRLVGVLVRYSRSSSRPLREAARTALLHALPNVTAAHAWLIVSVTQSHLTWLLGNAPDARLVLAALGALERAGGADCVDPIRRISHSPETPLGPSRSPEDYVHIRERAASCLVSIEQRLAADHRISTLLRPADSPSEEPLVRPASAAPVEETAQLVRPVDAA